MQGSATKQFSQVVKHDPNFGHIKISDFAHGQGTQGTDLDAGKHVQNRINSELNHQQELVSQIDERRRAQEAERLRRKHEEIEEFKKG